MKTVTFTTARSMERSVEVSDDFNPSTLTDEEWDELEERIDATNDIIIRDHQYTWTIDGVEF